MRCDLCFPSHEITGAAHIIPRDEIRSHARQYGKMAVDGFGMGLGIGGMLEEDLTELMIRRAREDQTDWAACDRAYALWQEYKAGSR